MPFINRGRLLVNTLQSFYELYKERHDVWGLPENNNYEVVVIEDAKNQEDIDPVLDSFRAMNINIKLVKSRIQDCYNPAPLFNLGASQAEGKYLILTSPEILHATNVLGGLDEFTLDDNYYIICSCKNVGRPKEARGGRPMVWYQHSILRNKQYHFCSALSRKLYNEVGGFDEEYGNGIAYDDDDFLRKIKESGVSILTRDDLETHHQWHDKITVKVPGYREKLMRNKQYYETKWQESIAL